jgi:hypothetical protein
LEPFKELDNLQLNVLNESTGGEFEKALATCAQRGGRECWRAN